MPLVTILIDLDHLLPSSPSTLEVERVSEYTAAYRILEDAVHGTRELSICVRHRAIAAWFTRAAVYYGEASITITRYTPREALAEKWQTAVPHTLTDEEIVQAHLLDLPLVARVGQTFWDILLEYFYGSLVTSALFPRGKLAVLLNQVKEKQWNTNAGPPLVAQALRRKLAHWQKMARRDVEQDLITLLTVDPEQLRQDFARYKLIRQYPPFLVQQVLGANWEIWADAHEDPEDLVVISEDGISVVPAIEYYLTVTRPHILVPTDLEDLLAQMSGLLLEEFCLVESLLQQHAHWLAPSLLRLIEQRFQPLWSTVEKRVERLRHLIAPALPAAPLNSWTAQTWLTWVKDEYMPYYAWLDRQGQRNEQVATYAFLFADWFYTHFLTLKHGSPTLFSFNALYQERETINGEGTVTLILMIDNLNFAFFDELMHLFNRHHFFSKDSGVRPVFSFVPTSTEVGKACIMAGQGDQCDLPCDSYQDIVVKAWTKLFRGKRIGYLSNIGELDSLQERIRDVYFLNYLALDKVLHEDTRESGRTHHEVVTDLFQALVHVVETFTTRFSIENRLNIYVMSDHGSTRIPQEEVNILDKAFFKGVTIDHHHRFGALSDESFMRLPTIVNTQCYLIDRARFKTQKNYLAARQYYRFVPTKETFYVHGGLTPEEVVVPFAHITYHPLLPIPPSLRLITTQFRYAIHSSVRFAIGNPNTISLERLRLRILNEDGEAVLIEKIEPKQEQEIECEQVFRKFPGAGATRPLIVRLSYECQGQRYGSFEQSFEIMLKSIMEVPDDPFDL